MKELLLKAADHLRDTPLEIRLNDLLFGAIPNDQVKSAQEAVKKFTGWDHVFHHGGWGHPLSTAEARDLLTKCAEAL